MRLSNPEAARLVMDENAQRLLRPFLGQENTAKAAATKVGVSLSLTAYWLGRFQKLGLIELVREEKRAGRPVKVYRTTADVFVAPFELLPSATLMEFFGSFGEAQQRRFLRALGRVSEAMAASDWGSGCRGATTAGSASMRYPTASTPTLKPTSWRRSSRRRGSRSRRSNLLSTRPRRCNASWPRCGNATRAKATVRSISFTSDWFRMTPTDRSAMMFVIRRVEYVPQRDCAAQHSR